MPSLIQAAANSSEQSELPNAGVEKELLTVQLRVSFLHRFKNKQTHTKYI